MSTTQPSYDNHRRKWNQFSQLGVEWWNLAAVRHEMREVFNRKEIENILSKELSLIEKYDAIKDNLNLVCSDLGEIYFKMEIFDPRKNEIKKHREKLRNIELWGEYDTFKDSEDIVPNDLYNIYSQMSISYIRYKEIKKHYEKLRSIELWNQYDIVKDNSDLTYSDLYEFYSQMAVSDVLYDTVKQHLNKLVIIETWGKHDLEKIEFDIMLYNLPAIYSQMGWSMWHGPLVMRGGKSLWDKYGEIKNNVHLTSTDIYKIYCQIHVNDSYYEGIKKHYMKLKNIELWNS